MTKFWPISSILDPGSHRSLVGPVMIPQPSIAFPGNLAMRPKRSAPGQGPGPQKDPNGQNPTPESKILPNLLKILTFGRNFDKILEIHAKMWILKFWLNRSFMNSYFLTNHNYNQICKICS